MKYSNIIPIIGVQTRYTETKDLGINIYQTENQLFRHIMLTFFFLISLSNLKYFSCLKLIND